MKLRTTQLIVETREVCPLCSMGRILKPVAGCILFLLAALWIVLVSISTFEGVITVQSNASPTQQTILAALRWLSKTNPEGAYLCAGLLLLMGLAILFWHPEKGWAFYFERSVSPAVRTENTQQEKLVENQTVVAKNAERETQVDTNVKPPEPLQLVELAKDNLREYTHRTSQELIKIYDTQNTVRADLIFEVYKGFWIKLIGKVTYIASVDQNYVVLVQTYKRESAFDTSCNFSRKHKNAILTLQIGDIIEVEGKIYSAQFALFLNDCEFTSPPISPLVIEAPQEPPTKMSPQNHKD